MKNKAERKRENVDRRTVGRTYKNPPMKSSLATKDIRFRYVIKTTRGVAGRKRAAAFMKYLDTKTKKEEEKVN